MINVTKTFLPPLEEYERLVKGIWERTWLTNGGPLLKELEASLKEKLNVKNLLFCNNGTSAIQLAIKGLDLKGKIITTPFSYVATVTSAIWENCTPVFADIRKDDFNINASEVEKLIDIDTCAILAVHVFGNPCDVDALEKLAQRHKLKVIYDGAHAFGTLYKGKSLLSYGDVSTCSFHATKLFHSIEGGAVITADPAVAHKIRLLHQFGHIADEHFIAGINCKNSEMHAAMGICVLPHVDDIINRRKGICELYEHHLRMDCLQRPKSSFSDVQYNYAYFPVVLESERLLLATMKELQNEGVNSRRYFYPSLNTLPYVNGESCPISEDISVRVLCLPLYYDLSDADVVRISKIVNKVLATECASQ